MRQRFGELVEEATEMGHLPVTVTYSSRYRPKTVSTRQFLRLFAGCSDYLPAPLAEAVGELFFETFGAAATVRPTIEFDRYTQQSMAQIGSRTRFAGFARQLQASVAAAVCVALLLSSAALAARRPSVWWNLPANVTAGSPTPFLWTAANLPARSKVVVQRREGTRLVWRTVRTLGGKAKGAGQLAALALGTYDVRLAALTAHGKVVAQRPVALRVFGQVLFGTLFNATPRAYTNPTNTFSYVNYGAFSDQPQAFLTATNNRCRAVHVDFTSEADTVAGNATVSVVQETSDPVSSTQLDGLIGSVDAQVPPGQSWGVTASYKSVGHPGQGSDVIFVNGWASCYSAAPVSEAG
jgi:hypothetical protein